MEVTWRLITFGLLGAMLLGTAAADIMIQPGYKQKSHGTQVPDDSEQVPTQATSSREQESDLAEEFERYRSLHRAIEGQLVHLIHEQSSQNLQQMAPEVVAVPMNFRPRIIRPLQRRLGGIRSFYLTPVGDYGIHPGGYGFGSHPHTYREFAEEPSQQQDYDGPARTQRTRSVDGGPAMDSRVANDVQNVATQSTLDADGVDGVTELQVPEIPATDEATVNKLVEPRQVGHRDDAIVGSPLDRIHYENPHYSKDQHHPSESTEISSNLMKVASAVENIIDSVAPGVMNYENRDSASTMTSHEDPAPNYRHDSQYPLSSENGQRTGYASVWKAPTAGTNGQPMTGQSYNSRQHSQNSGWSSIPPSQSSHAPKASNVHYSQQAPAVYPPLSNSMNNKNWLTTIHSNYPGYPSYRPDYQSYYGRPPTGSYRPHGNGPSYHPSGATSSASASANNPGFGNAPSYYDHGFNYPSGAHSSATASANNQSGFESGPSSYNHGSHYPNGATSSAAASANNNPGFGNGHSPHSYGSPYTNSATASATANSGNYGYNYPHRSSWNNAYGAQNPHASTNFVDQFGRTLFNVIPSSFHSLSTNPANYQQYLRNFIYNQIPGIYRQPGYWY